MNQDKNQDEQYLQLLSIFHYVVGGISGLFASIPLIHLTIGVFFLILGTSGGSDETVVFLPIGIIFVLIASVIILFGWGFAICMITAGRSLAGKKRYTFCLVMAGISCLFVPLGTILGVFTIITLNKPSVKQMFGVEQSI